MEPLSPVQPASVQYVSTNPTAGLTAVHAREESPAPQAQTRNQPARSLESVVGELNDTMQIINTSISFSIDKDTGKTVIRVMDTNSQKVIRQIPPEDMLRLAARVKDLLGVLYDKTR